MRTDAPGLAKSFTEGAAEHDGGILDEVMPADVDVALGVEGYVKTSRGGAIWLTM